MAEIDAEAADVVGFWREAGSEAWFRKNAEFDASFHRRFHDLHFAAARRERPYACGSPSSCRRSAWRSPG